MATQIKGSPLRPNVGIQQEYAKAILTLIRRMGDETKKVLREVFESTEVADEGFAQDDTRVSQARIRLNQLLDKYQPLFSRVAKKATKRMIDRTLKNSSITLGMSLKEMSANVTLNPDVLTGRLQEIVSASTTEAVSLIKLIPQKYLGDVQGQVMRSITTGQGMKDLVPYLNQKYAVNIRHARNVALDQTRKSYTSITAGRMEAIGVKQFQWLHVGGSQHPRKLHQEMHNEIYSLDVPPYIGDMYGQKVYGLPGTLPNCRCVLRPVVSFD